VKALQKRFPQVTLNTTTAGACRVHFGDGPEKHSFGTIIICTSFGEIDFAVMSTNTLFLFCLADINRYNVYYNNITNTLVHNGKDYPIVRKWKHLWFFLDDLESIIAYCHLTENELRQLYRRFGHPAAERLYKVLTKAGYDDVEESVLARINKFCHQCQIHGNAFSRFRFTIRDNADFNYRLIVDIMYIDKRPILHAVNKTTAF
jgi:hypothetical protein